ncbi:MAG: hypothetical protein EAZ36_01730 [Verrucomicrobia bacterium]|nr:MAG: hypothetical protein EAZ36_01730 [Verrucomicrobiota bacterium]
MNRILPHLVWASALPLFAPALLAQTSMSYSPDEINSSAIILSGANTPLTLQVATGTATQSGNISESGDAFGFAKDGAGTLILSGDSTYTGFTTVTAGTLQTGTTGALGTGALYVAATAAVHLTGGHALGERDLLQPGRRSGRAESKEPRATHRVTIFTRQCGRRVAGGRPLAATGVVSVTRADLTSMALTSAGTFAPNSAFRI